MTNQETILRDEFARLEDDWESASRYLSIFIDECQQTLDELTEALLALEAGGGREREHIEQLFVAAHRIKGSAASIGLNRPAKLAHLMEDILQLLVQNECALAPNVADGMLACTDGLRQYVNAMSEGRPGQDQFFELAQQLLEAQATCDAMLRPTQVEADMAVSEEDEEKEIEGVAPIVEAVKPQCANDEPVSFTVGPELHRQVAAAMRDEDRNENIIVGQVFFEPNLPLVGLKAQLIFSKLSNLGDIRYIDPPADELETLDELAALRFGLATEKTPDEMRQYLHIAGVQGIAIEPLARKRATVEKEKTVAAATAVTARSTTTEPGAKPAETLRVDVERLDKLMNLAGQLAIGKARVSQIGESLKTVLVEGEELQILNNLFETIHLLESVSNGIRQNVMDMRMLPIGPLFNRFHRVVRDIRRSNGKDIQLVIDGEKTELDKRMIDELGDPMIHLIRNAADHGIESPEARVAAGKPRQGTISLNAFHRGSSIVIRISDDGRGLDPDRIRAKAIEKGLASTADAELMSPAQLYQLIWLPGFSTAEKVTDVSGRGVGMDIVRSKIKDLNGMVDVESEPGRGTTFSIRLPLTLAVLPSLMVRIDKDVFAIPLESVAEIVRVARKDMTTVHGHWTVPLRDCVVGILTLGRLFGWKSNNHEDLASSEETMLVIIGEGDKQVGLAVDDVLGEEDIVIKSIADNYRNVAGVAGATILGDGRISLILDPPALMDMASRPLVGAGKL